MGRWQPGATDRLVRAAIELFAERGYEEATVAEIAARAGVTERTFFRHFSDKREVLFAGGQALQDVIVAAAAAAPPDADPVEAAMQGVRAAGGVLEERREFARHRSAVIAANPELRERELMKLAAYGAALAGVLRARGVSEPAAVLAAELAMAVFRIAFERWAESDGGDSLEQFVDAALGELRALAAA